MFQKQDSLPYIQKNRTRISADDADERGFLEFIRRNRLDQRHPLCTQNMSVTQVYCRLTIKPSNPPNPF
jgi:hypothetical protein